MHMSIMSLPRQSDKGDLHFRVCMGHVDIRLGEGYPSGFRFYSSTVQLTLQVVIKGRFAQNGSLRIYSLSLAAYHMGIMEDISNLF